MPLVINPGYGEVINSLRWSGDPGPMAVTIGVQSDATDLAGVQTLADRFRAAWNTNLAPHLSDQITLTQVEVRFQLAALPAAPVIAINSVPSTGTQTSLLLPQNSAWLVHKRSSFGGRGGRGRFYMPGVYEALVDDLGNIDATQLATQNAAYAAYLAQLVAYSAPSTIPVILHESTGAFAADPPHWITSLGVDPVIATQRRRLRH